MRRGAPTAVYVMEDNTDRRKVGSSAFPPQRLGELTSPKRPMRLLHATDFSAQGRKIERTAHHLLKLAGKHIEKEMFSATLSECVAAIERAERIVAGLEPAVPGVNMSDIKPTGIRLLHGLDREIEDWRRTQATIPAKGTAIRELVRLGLEYSKLREGAKERKPR